MGGGYPPRRREFNLHNTSRFSLLGWEDLGLSPTPLLLTRSRPCMYYLLLSWGCFFLSEIWFLYPAFPRFGFGLLRRVAPRLVLCSLGSIIGRHSGLDGLSPANASVVLESGSYCLAKQPEKRAHHAALPQVPGRLVGRPPRCRPPLPHPGTHETPQTKPQEPRILPLIRLGS